MNKKYEVRKKRKMRKIIRIGTKIMTILHRIGILCMFISFGGMMYGLYTGDAFETMTIVIISSIVILFGGVFVSIAQWIQDELDDIIDSMRN